jgi:hypothetical protein
MQKLSITAILKQRNSINHLVDIMTVRTEKEKGSSLPLTFDMLFDKQAICPDL